jgi:transposase
MGLMPVEDRWCSISTWKEEGQNLSATAHRLGKRLRDVTHWVRTYEATGGVEPAAKSGRKRVLGDDAAVRAHELLLHEDNDGASMVAQQLQREGLTPVVRGKQTVIRAAKRMGNKLGRPLVARRGRPRKQLTTANKQQRVDFCQANLQRDWSNVLITDRKRFNWCYPGAKVKQVQWLERGQQREAKKINHPEGVNVYAGLTVYGVTKLHEVTGTSKMQTSFTTQRGNKSKNITQEEYKEVLEKTFLKQGMELFHNHGVRAWMLQQDGDKAHNKVMKSINKWNKQYNSSIGLIQRWPPNSPDLSPIENLWAVTQRRVEARGCKTFVEFKGAVHEEWTQVTPEMAKRYMRSMPNRMKKCLEANGGMTKY